MKDLSYELATLCRHSAEGSFATRACRARGLQQCADELHQLGYKLKSARNLVPKHVGALVAHWRATTIGDATIRNRLGWLRWWADKVGKPGLMPKDNDVYGLEDRRAFKGNRARTLTADVLARVADVHVAMALKLEAAFGLRREEALKFRPALADRGSRIALKSSWCKGGRYREVPLTHPRQRVLLNDVRALVGDGSLIPPGKRYVDQLQTYKHVTRRAGLGQAHGLRHAYAQWRYKVLTGAACPAAGGRDCSAMTPAERARDRAARFEISHELGHGRIDVTDTYLGRRWPRRAA